MLPLIEKIDYVICYFLSLSFNTDINIFLGISINFYSVLVSVSCPKALFHLESDNLFRITVVVADWLG